MLSADEWTTERRMNPCPSPFMGMGAKKLLTPPLPPPAVPPADSSDSRDKCESLHSDVRS